MLFELKRIRKEAGLTQKDVAEKLGVPLGTYRNWEQLKNVPLGPTMSALASFLHVSPEALMGYDVVSPGTFASMHSDDDAFDWVPLYGKIAAGKPRELEDVDRHIQIRKGVTKRYPHAFLLTVDGPSMNRVIPDGAYALVDPDQKAPIIDGKIYAVRVNGCDATVKRVKKLTFGLELIPDSTDPTITSIIFDYNKDDTDIVTIEGRVVWYTLPDDYEL